MPWIKTAAIQRRTPTGNREGGIPEDVSSYVSATAANPRGRLRRYRPTLTKKILAWTGVVLGVLLVLTLLTSEAGNLVGDALLSVGFGAMMAVPGAYWLVCNRRDTRIVSDWVQTHQEYQANWELLARDEQAMFAPPEHLPVLPLRRWKTVAVVIVAAFFVAMAGSMLLPETKVA